MHDQRIGGASSSTTANGRRWACLRRFSLGCACLPLNAVRIRAGGYEPSQLALQSHLTKIAVTSDGKHSPRKSRSLFSPRAQPQPANGPDRKLAHSRQTTTREKASLSQIARSTVIRYKLLLLCQLREPCIQWVSTRAYLRNVFAHHACVLACAFTNCLMSSARQLNAKRADCCNPSACRAALVSPSLRANNCITCMQLGCPRVRAILGECVPEKGQAEPSRSLFSQSFRLAMHCSRYAIVIVDHLQMPITCMRVFAGRLTNAVRADAWCS